MSGTPPAGKTPVTVDLWEDFQCPACRAFEAANHTQLEAWAKQGVVKLVYKPVAFLDRMSTTNYSTRASWRPRPSSTATRRRSPLPRPALHQPAGGGQRGPDRRAARRPRRPGGRAAGAVASALSTERFKGWTVSGTDEFTQKFTGTPTVLVDGKEVKSDGSASIISPATLKAAVSGSGRGEGPAGA